MRSIKKVKRGSGLGTILQTVRKVPNVPNYVLVCLRTEYLRRSTCLVSRELRVSLDGRS